LTTERWDDERLDRLADAVEANRRDIDANSLNIGELTTNVSRLASTVKLHNQNFDILIQEIRGLRAENRRILTHLFGEQQSE
jgi:hypothetical protein